MKVVGAFIDPNVGPIVARLASGIRDFDLVGCGRDAGEVVALCKRRAPHVLLIGERFSQHLERLHELLALTKTQFPLFITVVTSPQTYSDDTWRAKGVRSSIVATDFTESSWLSAVRRADRAQNESHGDITLLSVYPNDALHYAIERGLATYPEFRLGPNCFDDDDLPQMLIERPAMVVVFGQRQIDTISLAQKTILERHSTEPTWLLMASHTDVPTLKHAAMCRIRYLISPEDLGSADLLAKTLHELAAGHATDDVGLKRVRRLLDIAVDDEDRRILGMLSEGRTNKEIADEVHFSEQTVKNRVSRVMKVANVSNRTELALLFGSA